MRSLDPLAGISVFIKVAETLNLSRAAEQIGLSKATISGQLKELEAKLGVRLFHRNNRAVVLTEAGEVYKNALAGVVTREHLLEGSMWSQWVASGAVFHG